MSSRGFVVAAAVLALLAGCTHALKDDTFIGYLDGQTTTSLGVTQLGGAPVTAAVAGGFLTLTDFGKNLTGWTFDKNVALANPAYLKLYYINATNAANPPKLLDLTTDFSEYSPFGEFNIAQLNTALAAIGVAPVGGATPLITLIKGRNLLGGWVSKDGKAAVGPITDDPNVGPPPADYVEISHLTELNSTAGVYTTSTSEASATLDITDNGDGSFDYTLFTDFKVGPNNKTLFFPNAVGLAQIKQVGSDTVASRVLSLGLGGQAWLLAASDSGFSGVFGNSSFINKLEGTAGEEATLYGFLDVSSISATYVNYGAFTEPFTVIIPAKVGGKPPKAPAPAPTKAPGPKPSRRLQL